MYRLLLFLILAISPTMTGCVAMSDQFTLDSVSAHSGYSNASIKGDDFQAVPTMVRLDWRLKALRSEYGRLTAGTEMALYSIVEPDKGIIAGISPLIRYTYPINKWVGAYVEGGAGPIYLSIDTYEQESSGFSFLDQIGGGIELSPTPHWGFLLGYRYTHISHGGLLDTRNRGIENNTFLFGVQFRFP